MNGYQFYNYATCNTLTVRFVSSNNERALNTAVAGRTFRNAFRSANRKRNFTIGTEMCSTVFAAFARRDGRFNMKTNWRSFVSSLTRTQ